MLTMRFIAVIGLTLIAAGVCDGCAGQADRDI
jgi:hypothetical protein